MLTPEDIDKQQFSKQFKGYAVEEVDDFLEELWLWSINACK